MIEVVKGLIKTVEKQGECLDRLTNVVDKIADRLIALEGQTNQKIVSVSCLPSTEKFIKEECPGFEDKPKETALVKIGAEKKGYGDRSLFEQMPEELINVNKLALKGAPMRTKIEIIDGKEVRIIEGLVPLDKGGEKNDNKLRTESIKNTKK